MISTRLSQAIYRQLINGKVVNQHEYRNDRLVPNELFDEVFNNLEEYQRLYENIGSELVLGDGYIFIRDFDVASQYAEVAMKIQALLLVIARGVTEKGYDFKILTEPDAGLSQSMAESLESEPNRDILDACKLKESLWAESKNILVERNLCLLNTKGNLVLTDGGIGFFNRLFASESASHEEEAYTIQRQLPTNGAEVDELN
mgnify:CR=1 FL=1|tara:strand:- start:1466 stop:2071 length:606 start_codon:yes stop_codon:yes gene_type:complete